ncbi:MAG: methyltransferase [Bacteroides sp.]|nr:methyltransferase [Bacteroides sp.]
MGKFRFKQFEIDDGNCAMKVGTDAVLLGAWTNPDKAITVVDAGCGSGIVGIMLAQRCDASIIAVDICHQACMDAESNARNSPWSDRIKILEGDITRDFPSVDHPILLVSNPPFFNEKLRSPDNRRALARHGDEFGVKELIELASRIFTTPDDSLAFIAPTSRTDEIEFMLSLNRLTPWRICKVYSKPDKESIRTLWQVGIESLQSKHVRREELYIRNADNLPDKEYIRLTSPFYLDR